MHTLGRQNRTSNGSAYFLLPFMAFLVGLWVTGCATKSTNQVLSDELGSGYSQERSGQSSNGDNDPVGNFGQGIDVIEQSESSANGTNTNFFIAPLPPDTPIEHVPNRNILFADDSRHMGTGDGQNTSDLMIVSGEPSILVDGSIYFAFNSWKLKDAMIGRLVASAKWLKSHEGIKVIIEGHCDERGSREYNVVLGEKRANVVRNFLRDLGVRNDQIATISYGEERPVCVEGLATCYAKNRRAAFQEM